VTALQDAGALICAYDPEAMTQAREMMQGVEFAEDAYASAQGADALVIVTEWDMFRALDLQRIKSLLKTPNIVDLRNIYSPKMMADMGLNYFAVGRSSVQ
jgi:UDPglucose 6-dehydrogenase